MTAAAARDAAPPRERPIPFRPEMVRAILAFRKKQTRRPVKPQPRPGNYLQRMWGRSPPPDPVSFGEKWLWREVGPDYPDDADDDRRCPYGKPGDRLWVREQLHRNDRGDWFYVADNRAVQLPRDHEAVPAMLSWAHHYDRDTCPSIHMPRFASRITLEITHLSVQQLQDITEADAREEGFPVDHKGDVGYDPLDAWQGYARSSFTLAWSQMDGAASWDANPWVWAITFRRVTP